MTQHRAAFARVSAYVIVNKEGESVASIAFKFPRDGAGRTSAYIRVFGNHMSRGSASGGGYDKQSAAVGVAARKIEYDTEEDAGIDAKTANSIKAFKTALEKSNGYSWDTKLQESGFNVIRAV